MEKKFQKKILIENPYDFNGTTKKIIKVIENKKFQNLIKKNFLIW